MQWFNLPPTSDAESGEELITPEPVLCVNCDRPRLEHVGPGEKCPTLFGKFYTTPAEITPED